MRIESCLMWPNPFVTRETISTSARDVCVTARTRFVLHCRACTILEIQVLWESAASEQFKPLGY